SPSPSPCPTPPPSPPHSFCRVMDLLGMGHRLFVPRLLATSKEDLLQADFEGALKFFRVQLPKRYRAAENARRLMEQACNIKPERNERRQQQGSTHSVEGKKKQTHRPLSHTSSVTERNKQVCCTALSLPPPLLLSLGGARLLRDSPPPHCQEQNLSAALFSSSSLP
uniref:Rab-GAP TBC domain-containing protein n=1 Tax=Neolamprologus brichardi TaxID=32507 RepID=A0A3Q4GCZ6_NEOBR